MGCGGSKESKATTGADKKGAEGEPNLRESLGKDASTNEDIRDKYDLGKILGSGSFGQVREATLKANPEADLRAVKMIERDSGSEDGEWSNKAIFVREVGLLQQIKHDNIIRYYDFYEDMHFLYVVMELCKGGEVFTKILELKRFSEKNAVLLGKQMLAAIEYIHKIQIAHRDIKAENFMLAEPCIHGKVKMIDFGMATKFEPEQVLTELCGSPHYLAPELIGQKYNQQADVWAFGVLLYLLMYGHYPYDAKSPRDIMFKILTEPIKWQTKVRLSKDGLDFLKKALEHDPKKRLTAPAALAHPWMQLANSLQDTELLPTDVIRSAHKKVTATKKTVDPKIEEARNKKFEAINEDFSNGVRHGKRLGETPKEEFMSKPEFLRRENKITTAPSRNIQQRRASLSKMLQSVGGGKSGAKSGGQPLTVMPLQEGSTIAENGEGEAVKPLLAPLAPLPDLSGGTPQRKGGRAASISGVPRRLSYIGALTGDDEHKLKAMYLQKKPDSTKTEPAKTGVPGSLDTTAE